MRERAEERYGALEAELRQALEHGAAQAEAVKQMAAVVAQQKEAAAAHEAHSTERDELLRGMLARAETAESSLEDALAEVTDAKSQATGHMAEMMVAAHESAAQAEAARREAHLQGLKEIVDAPFGFEKEHAAAVARGELVSE